MPITDDPLVTTAEAVELTGYPHQTINRWARQGILREAMKLPGVTGSRLYRLSDITRLMDERARKRPRADRRMPDTDLAAS